MAHRGDLVQICCEETSLDHFDPQRYSGSFDIDSKGEVVRCRLKGQDNPLRNAAMYHDRTKKKLFVWATSLELYRQIHSVVAEDIPLSEEPYWLSTISMNLAGRKILGKDTPAAAYVDMFEDDQKPVTPEDRKHLDTRCSCRQKNPNTSKASSGGSLCSVMRFYTTAGWRTSIRWFRNERRRRRSFACGHRPFSGPGLP